MFVTYVRCQACQKEELVSYTADGVMVPLGWKEYDKGHVCSGTCLMQFAHAYVEWDVRRNAGKVQP